MAEIKTLLNSLDPLAPYKVSGDLVLELITITAIVEDDPEGAAAAPCRVEVIEPHTLIVHQPPGGYPFENHQVHVTCTKRAGISLGDEIKFRVAS